VCSDIRFLNARNIRLAVIHRQFVEVYVESVTSEGEYE
jgi:hypothetical protein